MDFPRGAVVWCVNAALLFLPHFLQSRCDSCAKLARNRSWLQNPQIHVLSLLFWWFGGVCWLASSSLTNVFEQIVLYFTAFACCALSQVLANKKRKFFKIAVFYNISVAIFVWYVARSSRCRQMYFHVFLYFTMNSCWHRLKTFSFWTLVSFTPLVDRLGRDLETKRGPWKAGCGSRWDPKQRDKICKGGKIRGCEFKGVLVMGNFVTEHRLICMYADIREFIYSMAFDSGAHSLYENDLF